MTSKDEEKEIELLEEKIRHGSDDLEDYMKLRDLYFASGQFDRLLTIVERILTTFRLAGGDLAGMYFDIGETLRIVKRFEEAKCSFQKSLQTLQEIDDSSESLYLKAMNHYKLFYCLSDDETRYHHAREAITYFQTVIQHSLVHEKQYQSYTYLADMYAQIGEYDNALCFHQAALEFASNPEDTVWALTGIATIYGKKQEFDTAVHYFEEALRKAGDMIPTAIVYMEFGRMYFEVEQFAKASQMFREALKCIGDDPELRVHPASKIETLWYLGRSAYEEDDLDNAVQTLLKLLEQIDDEHFYYADSHLTLGHCYILLGNYEKALEHYNYVLTASQVTEEEITTAKESITQIPSGKYQVH